MNYLARFLNAQDSTASLKHAAYGLVVLCGCFWLTWDMIRGPITSEWNVAFGLLLGAAVTGKVWGKPVGVEAPSAPGSGSVPENGSKAAGGTP